MKKNLGEETEPEGYDVLCFKHAGRYKPQDAVKACEDLNGSVPVVYDGKSQKHTEDVVRALYSLKTNAYNALVRTDPLKDNKPRVVTTIKVIFNCKFSSSV